MIRILITDRFFMKGVEEMRKAIQKFFVPTIFFVLALAIAGCSDDKPKEKLEPVIKEATFNDEYKSSDSWLIYWYVCGTDLESDNGYASTDFLEIMSAKLPENIKVLIQTGGTNQWQNNVVTAGAIERFLYSSNGLERLESLPDADMGDADTLADFIRYGSKMSADHRVFIFWDHGGGSAAGVCFDERTDNSLNLNDIRNAFTAVYNPSADNPPFEMIGFDACLMATYDTVNTLDGLTRFMTASEEVEPGLGWNYGDWLDALAQNPAMGGAKLGQVICDSYYSACSEYDLEDTVTLSVIDLNQLSELRTAYEAFGLEALKAAYKNPRNFFSKFGRGAVKAENYGGNNRQTGYTNMVDLVDLAKTTKSILPKTSDRLISAVDNAVVYRVNGPYRDKGGGISSFYSYSGEEGSLVKYLNQDAAPFPQKVLYYYLIYGEIPDNVKTYIEKTEVPETPVPVPTTPPAQRQDIFQISQLDDFPVQKNKDGNVFVQLNKEQMDLISGVRCQLAYLNIEEDIVVYLGSDADIIFDWPNGKFTDNFRGVWPMLDGHYVYVEVTASNDGYNLYSIPVRLNGVECNLLVAYVYADEKYYILGARKGIDNNGMSDRDLIKLRAGDEITTIHYCVSISGDDKEFTKFENETFTVTENTQIKDEPIGNGNYIYAFEFVSPNNESVFSKAALFDVNNGKINLRL